MGHSHPSVSAPREAQNIITNKMPIPKHLPERAAALPQAVSINQSRPTLSGGPSNSGNGVLSQPVLAKTPGYSMEGDGDRVLSKKKLDELVRQVTGGGQGLEGGEGLAPDVEEVRVFAFSLFAQTELAFTTNQHVDVDLLFKSNALRVCGFLAANSALVYPPSRRQLR